MTRNDLKKYLSKNNLTQSAFAEMTGIARVQVGRILNGKRTPSSADALAIENVTGIPMRCWFEVEPIS